MIKRICLAGGSCSGKSTALKLVPKRLPEYNFITVPEAASIVLATNGGKHTKETQDKIFEMKVKLEANAEIEALISLHPKNIVLYDRGILDGMVYHPKTYHERLARHGMDHEMVIAGYDAVIYMRSAARGAREHYSNETNPNRTENPDRAASKCEKLEAVWGQHPNMVVIDNESDFKGKIDQVVWHVIQIMQQTDT